MEGVATRRAGREGLKQPREPGGREEKKKIAIARESESGEGERANRAGGKEGRKEG